VAQMRPDSVIDLVKGQLWPGWRQERERLDAIDLWARWTQDRSRLPRLTTPELRYLEEISRTPWLGLVVTTVAQCMYVDNYRSSVEQDPEDPRRGPWWTWSRNGFDRRQIAVHRAALTYGYSYVKVLPGEDFLGEPMSVMTGVSPRKMWAVYRDPAVDDWPMLAMHVDPQPGDMNLVRVYDEEFEYFLSVDSEAAKPEFIEAREHGAGVPPVVRYTNQLDLDGRADGEVEPYIGAARRINKTAYDRLLAQHYNSWKVRTVTGMAKPDTDDESNQIRMLLRQNDLLIAEDADTKFGTLDETPLEGFISSWRADVEALAAVSQTPAHQLTGQLVNLSAEALAAARAALTQKVFERQKSFGASHAQTLRLAAHLEGDEEYATDVLGRVSWQDMEIRSMSQAVDALGKAATMLEVPKRALWGRIPGVERSDVDEWASMVPSSPLDQVREELERQARGEDG
jgi:HPt (histidine-containing phosphotransfer) domain-containing protein